MGIRNRCQDRQRCKHPNTDIFIYLDSLYLLQPTAEISLTSLHPTFQLPSITQNPTNTPPQVDKARAEAAKAEGKLEQYSKDAKKATMKEVDAFDRTVEKKASEAKSGISSWFGGK